MADIKSILRRCIPLVGLEVGIDHHTFPNIVLNRDNATQAI